MAEIVRFENDSSLDSKLALFLESARDGNRILTPQYEKIAILTLPYVCKTEICSLVDGETHVRI